MCIQYSYYGVVGEGVYFGVRPRRAAAPSALVAPEREKRWHAARLGLHLATRPPRQATWRTGGGGMGRAGAPRTI